MMIGFVQDMELSAVLDVVNSHITTASLPHLKLENPFVVTGVNRLNHEFERPFSRSPFTLFHQWIDIRDIPKAAKPAAISRRAPKNNHRTGKS
jgi:hypothetical protein